MASWAAYGINLCGRDCITWARPGATAQDIADSPPTPGAEERVAVDPRYDRSAARPFDERHGEVRVHRVGRAVAAEHPLSEASDDVELVVAVVDRLPVRNADVSDDEFLPLFLRRLLDTREPLGDRDRSLQPFAFGQSCRECEEHGRVATAAEGDHAGRASQSPRQGTLEGCHRVGGVPVQPRSLSIAERGAGGDLEPRDADVAVAPVEM